MRRHASPSVAPMVEDMRRMVSVLNTAFGTPVRRLQPCPRRSGALALLARAREAQSIGARAPLLLARDPVAIPVHLCARAVREEVFGFGARGHL